MKLYKLRGEVGLVREVGTLYLLVVLFNFWYFGSLLDRGLVCFFFVDGKFEDYGYTVEKCTFCGVV